MQRFLGSITNIEQAEARLQGFFDLALDMVCFLDVRWRILKANDYWHVNLGYHPDALVGTSITELMDPNDVKANQHVADNLKDTDSVHGVITRLRHSNGQFLTFEWHLYKMGQVLFASARDITDRLALEEKLELVSTRLRLANEGAQIATFEWNLISGEHFWDEQMYLLTGIAKSGEPLNIERWVSCLHPEDKPRTMDAVREATEQGQDLELEVRAIMPDHSIRYLRVLGRVHRNAMGWPEKIYGCCWDVSEPKRLEFAWEKTRKELESFSYSVSHDLRSPLRGIVGWSQALVEDYGDHLDEDGKQLLERVKAEALRMGLLIDDLLKLSRISQKEMVKIKVNLTEVSRRIADRLKEAHPEQLIRFVIETDLVTEGDAEMIEVMLTNLLGNAVKFSSKRREAIVEVGQTVATDQRPVFYVRDNGAGFDAGKARNLFGAFQRLHRQSEFSGTGIGLATVARVVNLHEGSVWADAKVDEGATFFFRLKH
ncbi:MAG: PAS domain-containing protein [Cyclobacteriaceae bacterium]|nr:PAS domain-containing protein [Cyclobacteriaceae bacterium]